MLAAGWPSEIQISRVNAATDVFPLVPVTAAITCGWRGNNAAAANAKDLRVSWTLTKAMSDGSGADGRRSAMTAAAPAASACGTKSSPSALPPLTATNRSPGRTVRLSALTPVTSSAAKRASLTASAVRRSASLIVFRSSTFAAAYRPGIAAMRSLGSPRAPREFAIRGSPLSRQGVGLSRAGARQDQLVGRWQLKAWLKPEQGGDAGDDGTAAPHCLPSPCRGPLS